MVDDSADLRGYIRDHFAPRFRVIEAADGAEGIELARAHLPDIVLSDVMMPGTDGHELVRTLRASAETDFLSIVLLTAQAEDDQRLQGLERGAGCILFVRDGVLGELEGYSYEEEWPVHVVVLDVTDAQPLRT